MNQALSSKCLKSSLVICEYNTFMRDVICPDHAVIWSYYIHITYLTYRDVQSFETIALHKSDLRHPVSPIEPKRPVDIRVIVM